MKLNQDSGQDHFRLHQEWLRLKKLEKTILFLWVFSPILIPIPLLLSARRKRKNQLICLSEMLLEVKDRFMEGPKGSLFQIEKIKSQNDRDILIDLQNLLKKIHDSEEYLKTFQKKHFVSIIEWYLMELQIKRKMEQFKFFSRSKNQKIYREFKKLKKKIDGYNEIYLKRMKEKYRPVIGHLDDFQKHAVVADDLYNLVIAGAGSGKTEVLTVKIAYLILKEKNPVFPKKILALAFQNKAAGEMKERLEKKYGIRVKIKTFHALGKEIICRSGEVREVESDSEGLIREIFFHLIQKKEFQKLILDYLECVCGQEKIMNEKDLIQTEDSFKEHIESLNGKKVMESLPQQVERFIKIAKNCSLTPVEITKRLAQEEWSSKQVAFARMGLKIYEAYEEALNQKNRIDFPDMINQAIVKLKIEPDLCRNEWDYILIDEYQDISQQRYELIRLLLERNKKAGLFCVGDDWQSIMSFSGSDLNFFTNFHRYFPDCLKMFMPVNYRSCHSIVATGQEAIQKNILLKRQIEKKCVAFNQKKRKIQIFTSMHKDTYFDSYCRQIALHCSRQIEEFLKDPKNSPRDVMILFRGRVKRTLKLLETIQSLLKSKNIEYRADKNSPGENAVQIMTCHGSKGLQAKMVILVDVVKGVFPSEIEEQDIFLSASLGKRPEKEEEERRLFYVAVTRAIDQLMIYTQKSKKSVFLQELSGYVNDQELQYSVPNNKPLKLKN